jgi:hypothetical protein
VVSTFGGDGLAMWLGFAMLGFGEAAYLMSSQADQRQACEPHHSIIRFRCRLRRRLIRLGRDDLA